jgi:aryl-alcohol dehydrogenase-like predicted oxidoreductase
MMSSSGSSAEQSKELFTHQIGVGTWSWGDKLFWGFEKEYGVEDAHAVFNECMNLHMTFIDTAESYGSGESERLIGVFHKDSKKPIYLATKFIPYPWRLSRINLRNALLKSLKRLGCSKVDLYQIHWSYPIIPINVWVEEIAKLQQNGLIGSIGVSNFNLAQTENAIITLKKFGLKLAAIQVEYNLLNRSIEMDGLLSLGIQEGIRVIAYSPLCQGLLTGKYSQENPPTGIRGMRYHNQLRTMSPLISLLRKLAEQYGGKSPAAVALNWTICKRTLPIPGAKTVQQLRQNAGALGWMLSDDDIAQLDEVSTSLQLGL